jgi:acetyl esterase/lipase
MDQHRVRPMVVICPGGGYEFISDREAEPIAIQMNAMGLHACILRYSVKPAVFPNALEELARAVVMIRENAKQWNVDPNTIILAGFSAGAHLVTSLGTFWCKPFLEELVGVESELMRPNGLILGYPVVSSGEYGHQGSFKALLGEKYQDEKQKEFVSLEKQISSDTPKAFIWHTFEDQLVRVENTLLLVHAMRKSGVNFELHIYPKGAHGLSLGNEETEIALSDTSMIQTEVQNWITMAGRWIKSLNSI